MKMCELRARALKVSLSLFFFYFPKECNSGSSTAEIAWESSQQLLSALNSELFASEYSVRVCVCLCFFSIVESRAFLNAVQRFG